MTVILFIQLIKKCGTENGIITYPLQKAWHFDRIYRIYRMIMLLRILSILLILSNNFYITLRYEVEIGVILSTIYSRFMK